MKLSRISEFNYWPQVISIALLGLGFLAYRYFAYYDTRSSDAYVSANVVNISPIVSGPVIRLYVKDNQMVKKGQKLIELDPEPYDYAMQRAKAGLNIAKLNYANDQQAITVAREQLKEKKDALKLSQNYLSRYKILQSKGDLAEIQYIALKAKVHEQEAGLIASARQLKIAEQNLNNNGVLAAEAAYLESAYLYNHTTIVAPEDGYVTNVSVRQGQYVHAGEGLFALVETKNWWVVTRYRETAIRLVKPGDKAKITLSMYPGKVFYGHVKSVGWGINRVQSGNVAPSTLSYLEATEDWIKIAQRFPVRIYFDEVSPEYPLRIGASATTTTYR